MYPNRTMCDALEEMRACFKTYNFAPISGLIEEVQSMGNRMEASLLDKANVDSYRDELRDLKKDRKKLRREIKDLEDKKESLGDKNATR